MPKFFTGLDLSFFFFCFLLFFFFGGGGGGKLEGGEKKMQISGEPMPIFFNSLMYSPKLLPHFCLF